MQSAFDPGQIARMLGVGDNLVRKWINEGKLPAYLIPFTKRHKVRYEDLKAFCKEHDLMHLFDPVKPLSKYIKRKSVLLCGVDPSMVKQITPLLDELHVDPMHVKDHFDIASLAIHKKVLGVAVDFGLGRDVALEIGRRVSEIRNETQRVALVYDDEEMIEPERRAATKFNVVLKYPFKLEELAELLTLSRREPKYGNRYKWLRPN